MDTRLRFRLRDRWIVMKGLTRLRWNPIDKFLQGAEDAVELPTVPIFPKVISLRDYPTVGDSPEDVFCRHKVVLGGGWFSWLAAVVQVAVLEVLMFRP
jgi:hypothetical protein